MDLFRDQKASVADTQSSILSIAVIRRTIADQISQLRGTSIRAKSARAVLALGIGTGAGRAVRFVRLMILARILAPDQIGTMSIIMSISLLSEALTEVGVRQSIIQNKKGADIDYLNAAWWMQVVRGLFFYGITFVLAPWISNFYNKPEMEIMLRVAFLAVVFRGCISPRAHVLEKEYKFGWAAFLVQGSAVLGAIISVVLAWIMKSVWALVIGFVSEMAILCILSFILVPFRPRFTMNRASFRELMKYARGMVGLPILTAISFQGPILILGKVISEDLLGLYYYAALLAYIPIDLHMRIISPVLLPAFSDRQDNEPALCRGLVQATQWTALLIVPFVVFMICCAGEILSLAYGSRYAAMAFPFVFLSLHVITQNETGVMSGLYLAIGRPDLQRRFTAVRTAIIICLVYPASIRFGALGSAASVFIACLAVLLIQSVTVRSVIGLGFGDYLRAYVPGVLLSLPVIAVVGLLHLFGINSAMVIVAVGALSLAVEYIFYLGRELVKGRTFSKRTWGYDS